MEACSVTCLRDNLDQYLSCWASQLIPDGFCSGALDAEGLQRKSDVFIQSSDRIKKPTHDYAVRQLCSSLDHIQTA